jgi:hypothetical protein
MSLIFISLAAVNPQHKCCATSEMATSRAVASSIFGIESTALCDGVRGPLGVNGGGGGINAVQKEVVIIVIKLIQTKVFYLVRK